MNFTKCAQFTNIHICSNGVTGFPFLLNIKFKILILSPGSFSESVIKWFQNRHFCNHHMEVVWKRKFLSFSSFFFQIQDCVDLVSFIIISILCEWSGWSISVISLDISCLALLGEMHLVVSWIYCHFRWNGLALLYWLGFLFLFTEYVRRGLS